MTSEDLECRRCGVALSVTPSEHSSVVYYRCSRCGSIATSSDAIALKSLTRTPSATKVESDSVGPWQSRLDAFVARANHTDPYAKLGLTSRATLAEARARLEALTASRDAANPEQAPALAELFAAFDVIRDRLAAHALRPEPRALARRRPERWKPTAKPTAKH